MSNDLEDLVSRLRELEKNLLTLTLEFVSINRDVQARITDIEKNMR